MKYASDKESLAAQAAELERLMPQLGRRLFTIDMNDPASELPVTQLRVCSVLQAGPETMSALADELGISLSAVTQIADRLERAGLVRRVAENEDRRMKKLLLTEHGYDVMRVRLERRTAMAASALAGLTIQRRREVLGALRDLLAAVGQTASGNHCTSAEAAEQQQIAVAMANGPAITI